MMLLIVCLGLSVFGMQVATNPASPCEYSDDINKILDNTTKFLNFLADKSDGTTGCDETCCICVGLLPAENVSTLSDFILEMNKYNSVMQALWSKWLTYMNSTNGKLHHIFGDSRDEIGIYNNSLNYEYDLLTNLVLYLSPMAHPENLHVGMATVDVCQLNSTDCIYKETKGLIGKLNTVLTNLKC